MAESEINRKFKKIDAFFLIFILISVFFLRYVQVLYETWYFFDGVLLTYMLVSQLRNNHKRSYLFYIWSLLMFSFLLIVLSINIFKFGIGLVFINNLLMIFTPVTLIFYISYLTKKYSREVLLDLNIKLVVFLNFYFWLNAPVISIQIITETFLMERFLSWGMYNFDHMTGFMGPFGTGIINIFWNSLLIGNIVMFNVFKNKKWLILFYTEVPVMLILSYFNENKSFIPTFIVFLISFGFYLFFSKNITLNSIFKTVIVFVFVFFMGLTTYNTVEPVKEQVEKVFELSSDLFADSVPSKHNERAYLNYLAFTYYNADTTGIGINTLDFENQTIHPNLGLNSLSLILIQGGIWYYLCVIALYSLVVVSCLRNLTRINAAIIYIIFLFVFAYCSIITQPFRDHYMIFMIAMLVLILSTFNLKITKKIK